MFINVRKVKKILLQEVLNIKYSSTLKSISIFFKEKGTHKVKNPTTFRGPAPVGPGLVAPAIHISPPSPQPYWGQRPQPTPIMAPIQNNTFVPPGPPVGFVGPPPGPHVGFVGPQPGPQPIGAGGLKLFEQAPTQTGPAQVIQSDGRSMTVVPTNQGVMPLSNTMRYGN